MVCLRPFGNRRTMIVGQQKSDWGVWNEEKQ